MPLTPGSRFGAYDVIAPLGAGGMGVVYRARDGKLGRDVALKVLSDSVTHDPSRVARFRREAQLLASLNHPHIGGIYGLEEVDGVLALVLELVEGPTLADRIAEGALPCDEAVPIARQIAQALEAAHEQGIVHRDLKPANIKLRSDGTVKVLDFGLAKALDTGSRASDISQSPTLTSAMSAEGIILGTAAYMAPEQAAGKTVDKRSDIWSFGVVLLEMLTGRKVFDGETVSHVLAAVLRADPDWSSLPGDTPESIRRLLQRCLEKDRKRRLDSAAAIGLELDDAAKPATIAPPSAVSRSRMHPGPAAALLLGGALIAALAMWAVRAVPSSRPPAPAPRVRFTITLPSTLPLAQGAQAATRDFAVAPDGSFLVYRAGAQGQLVVRWFDRLDAVPLAGVSDASMPFVSPDSQWIGFVDSGLVLKKVAATGGAPVTVTRLPVWPRGASWVDDATMIVGTNSPTTGLLRVPAGGGDPVVLTTPDRARNEEGHVLPWGLPGGRAVLFTIGAANAKDAQIALLDLDTGQQTTLIRGGRDGRYVSSGHLVFLSDLSMSAVRFDLATRTVVGEPVRIMDAIADTPTSALNAAVSDAGTLVYVPRDGGAFAARSLLWVDRQGRETPIAVPARPYSSARLSPDGASVALAARDQEHDIWVWSLARQTLTRLTFDPDVDMSPVWTPDSRRIVFASTRTGVYNLYVREVDGSSGQDARLTTGANTQLPDGVTPDGAFIIGREVRPQTKSDVVRFSLGPRAAGVSDEAEDLVQTSFDEWNASVSPDGRFVAYQSDESGVGEVYVRPYGRPSTERWQVSSGGGAEPAWARGGRELIYLNREQQLTSVTTSDAPAFHSSAPVRLSSTAYATGGVSRSYDVTPDGQRFLVMRETRDAASDAPPGGFVVVQSWLEELARLLPER